MDYVNADDADLESAPIDPSWITDGDPRARSRKWLVSGDGTAEYYIWDCTGGTFLWTFDADETVTIVEGEVRVTAPDAEPVWLRRGDSAHFRAGTRAEWHVPEYVRKHATLRSPLPGPAARGIRTVRAIKRAANRSRREALPARR